MRALFRPGAYAAAMMDADVLRARLLQGQWVMDAGSATTLEAMGHDLSDHLWSARLLRDDPGAIRDMHLAFLHAGAHIIETATYQASRMGFIKAGMTAAEADTLLVRGVELARDAIEEHLASPDVDLAHYGALGRPLLAASLGPYGAALADGSEYRGHYGVEAAVMQEFHAERFAVLAGSPVDFLAIETMPDLTEAAAVIAALRAHPAVPALLSFSCNSATTLCGGEPWAEAVALAATLDSCIGVGINCTAPEHIDGLLASAADTAPALPRFVYPNSGRVWDAVHRCWLSDGVDVLPRAGVAGWRTLGAQVVGGCCGLGPVAVAALVAG